MLEAYYAKQFKRDIKRLEKSGQKDIERLKAIMTLLIEEKPLNVSHKDHALKGNYKGRRECHIEPDWLLIYKIDNQDKAIFFERTGSHADLFE